MVGATTSTNAPSSLFSDRVRVRDGPSAYTTPTYEVLDERVGPMWDAVRSTLDAWFSRLPVTARAQLRERFADRDLAVHLGALWELYLHEAFTRLGFKVDVDIGRDAGDGRRPDLLVSRGPVRFYVEATAVHGADVLDPAQRRLAAHLHDLIDRAHVQDFLVELEVDRYGTRTPGRRDVVAPLESWLGGLDAEAVSVAEKRGAPPEMLTVEFSGWRMSFTAIPLELRGDHDHRVLGAHGEGIAEIDDITPLRRKLKRKAGHYGELDAPYAIAVLCAGTFVEARDIEGALFGSIGGAYHPETGFRWTRNRNGLWMHDSGPTYTRVSAVLSATGLSATSVATVTPCWWSNPWARAPIDFPGPWDHMVADDRGHTDLRPTGERPGALVGLSERWPFG